MHPVGYVVHVRTPGTVGGETRSYQLAEALAAGGAHVHLYGQIDNSFRWAHGVRARRLRRPFPLAVPQLLSDFRRYDVGQVIERYQFPLFNVGLLAQQLRNRSTILEIHGFPIEEYALLAGGSEVGVDPLIRLLAQFPPFTWGALQARQFRQAAHFIVTSHGTRDILAGMGVPTERISVVHNCVDPGRFDPAARDLPSARDSLGFPAENQIVLYAGSLFHEELSLVIEAAPLVIAHQPSARFVFMGPGSPDSLATRAREMGLTEGQISFVPPVPHDQMPAMLAASDVVLAPYSLQSGRFMRAFHYSPLKVMEALAMQKAVVTVNAPELLSVFDGVANVQFVQSGTRESWFEGILQALQLSNNPRLAQGRAFIMDGYRWQDAAEHYLSIIRSLEQAV